MAKTKNEAEESLYSDAASLSRIRSQSHVWWPMRVLWALR